MTTSTHAAIEATGLSRTFGKTTALDGIDLSIPRSGITAILGANGAGKTTFINCALGLLPKSGGHLSVFGGKPGSGANRQRTGGMLQDANLPDQLSAVEHLDLFASYYRQSLSVDEVVDLCALSDFATKRYGSLSGGQKRRVQFALAVIGQPDLIFLDEPTTGLDAEARRGLWATIDNLAGQGRSIVLTTHYLEEADALADRILVFNKGRVIADGSPTEIREAVGDALIKCVTTLDVDAISRMPAVRAARPSGRYTEIISLNAPKTLTTLLPADPAISDLTVSKPSLEDAFLDITKTPSAEAQS
ncbi:MAG: ABC transporter ATP-binding protein [Pseudomonadota bacterium]